MLGFSAEMIMEAQRKPKKHRLSVRGGEVSPSIPVQELPRSDRPDLVRKLLQD
jgi:hypothetical protein